MTFYTQQIDKQITENLKKPYFIANLDPVSLSLPKRTVACLTFRTDDTNGERLDRIYRPIAKELNEFYSKCGYEVSFAIHIYDNYIDRYYADIEVILYPTYCNNSDLKVGDNPIHNSDYMQEKIFGSLEYRLKIKEREVDKDFLGECMRIDKEIEKKLKLNDSKKLIFDNLYVEILTNCTSELKKRISTLYRSKGYIVRRNKILLYKLEAIKLQISEIQSALDEMYKLK